VGALKTMREALAADLTVLGVPAAAAWPIEIAAPCVFVTPALAGEYVTPGPNFGGEYTVFVDVVIMVEHAAIEIALVALEDLLELALVHTADWALRAVDPPAPTTITDNGAQYLATVLHLSKSVRI